MTSAVRTGLAAPRIEEELGNTTKRGPVVREKFSKFWACDHAQVLEVSRDARQNRNLLRFQIALRLFC